MQTIILFSILAWFLTTLTYDLLGGNWGGNYPYLYILIPLIYIVLQIIALLFVYRGKEREENLFKAVSGGLFYGILYAFVFSILYAVTVRLLGFENYFSIFLNAFLSENIFLHFFIFAFISSSLGYVAGLLFTGKPTSHSHGFKKNFVVVVNFLVSVFISAFLANISVVGIYYVLFNIYKNPLPSYAVFLIPLATAIVAGLGKFSGKSEIRLFWEGVFAGIFSAIIYTAFFATITLFSATKLGYLVNAETLKEFGVTWETVIPFGLYYTFLFVVMGGLTGLFLSTFVKNK